MRKQVMVRAWELARQGVKNFGGKVVDFFRSALAIAWKEAKGGVKMVGSEKQVKWATEIVSNVNKALEAVNGVIYGVSNIPESVATEAEEAVKNIKSIINSGSAVKIINAYKGVNGQLENDLYVLASNVYTIVNGALFGNGENVAFTKVVRYIVKHM